MRKVCSILSTLLLIALLLAAVAFVGPMALGYKEMAVLSGSMEPAIPVGSIVCVDEDILASDVQPGDVVTYRLPTGDTFVTHRVLSVDFVSRTMVTKGDANEVEDGEISLDQLYGKVKFHIPYLGFVSANLRTPVGILSITGLVVVIILLNTLPALLTKEEPQEAEGEEKPDRLVKAKNKKK